MIAAGAIACFSQTTGTTTIQLTVGPEAAITITNATTTLTAATTTSPYTGTTNFTYNIRTSVGTGAGSIQLQITTDFSPSGGPSVATPPTAGDKLTYTCTVPSPATACSGNITSSTSSQTSVATFGADAHSAAGGSSGSVGWSLTNDVAYKSGSYSATATFTISAT